ncbi:MAG: CHAT domain-containing protein [Kiloniellaceae bacterium]
MLKRVLLATSDPDIGDLMFQHLEEAETDLDPTLVNNAKSFQKKVAADRWKNFDLLIIDNDIYHDRRTPAPLDISVGLELLRELKNREVSLPSILLAGDLASGSFGELLQETQRLQNCELVVKRGNLDEAVTVAIGRLQALALNRAGKRSNAAPEYQAEIEINIADQVRQEYHFRYRTSNALVCSPPKALSVRWNILEDLCAQSRTLRTLEHGWESILKGIGRSLVEELRRCPEFFKDFYRIQGLENDLDNLFIRFSVSRHTYDVACEALYEDEDGFLMLRAPVTRKVNANQSRTPLFQVGCASAEPINILFIESDVSGFVPDLKRGFEKLKNIKDERVYFEEIQKGSHAKAPKVPIGQIYILRSADQAEGFEQTVMKHLTGKTNDPEVPTTFHVVHFAGHSFFDSEAEDDPGGLVFPGKYPKVVRIRQFAQWLDEADTRLAYLSSCRGSDAEVAFELAREGVPTVIGFRWDVDDILAAEHAKAFYEELLFDRPILEQAFLCARRAMNARCQENRIWAASTMIHQVQN